LTTRFLFFRETGSRQSYNGAGPGILNPAKSQVENHPDDFSFCPLIGKSGSSRAVKFMPTMR
jgi:hypothetical protein